MGQWGDHFKQVGRGRWKREGTVEQIGTLNKMTVRAIQIIWEKSGPGREKSQCKGPGASGAGVKPPREEAKEVKSER